MTLEEIEAEADATKATLVREGLWDKIHSMFMVRGEYIILKDGDEINVYLGCEWL